MSTSFKKNLECSLKYFLLLLLLAIMALVSFHNNEQLTTVKLSYELRNGFAEGKISILGAQCDDERPQRYSFLHPNNRSLSPRCDDFMTCFVKRVDSSPPIPFVALLSHPGSGNTWTRYLIEGLTGIFTGEIYHDKRLRNVFYGYSEDPENGTTYVTKTHKRLDHNPWNLFKLYSFILLIRNVEDAIMTVYNFRRTHSHVLHVEKDALRHDQGFAHLVKNHLHRWKDLNSHSLQYCKQVRCLVVRYEDLIRSKASLKQNLMAIAKFLQVNVYTHNFSERLDCLMTYPQGLFKREHDTEYHELKRNMLKKIHKLNDVSFPKAMRTVENLISDLETLNKTVRLSHSMRV